MRITHARWWTVGVAIVVMFLGARVYHHFNPQSPLHSGDRLVALQVLSIDGDQVTLNPPHKAEIINVFATWCGPCRMETPAFIAATARLRAQGIELIGIDQEEYPAQVTRFVRQFDVPYPVYVDESGITHDVLGARVIPTTIYIDGSGVIRWIHSGPIDPRQFSELIASTKE